MRAAATHFSRHYAEAREKFLAAASGLEVSSYAHPERGLDGEPLAMDVACDGDAGAARLLILSSGCHGVEGFCGSGIQVALLSDPGWRAMTREAGVAVLYLHALNPYGFSWCRRVTHENVDLNRNFQDFSQPLPANPGYDRLAGLLVPDQWPPTLANKLAVLATIARHGLKAAQAAVSGGQYDHPQGLFYGGRGPTWSQTVLRQVLRVHAGRCRALACIDLHSGLGPSGVGERIFAGRNEPAALRRAYDWWGDRLTTVEDGSSTSAVTAGNLWSVFHEECPQAEYTGIVMEYGTAPMMRVIDALRADQWLANHPQAPPLLRDAIRRQMRDAFYTDTDEWKRAVVEQGMEVARQAVTGLRAAPER